MKIKDTSRRGFLKTALAAGAAPYWVPASVLGDEERPAPSQQLNVACIGVGGIMSVDLPAAVSVPGVNIVALCDVHDRAIANFRQKFQEGNKRLALAVAPADTAR